MTQSRKIRKTIGSMSGKTIPAFFTDNDVRNEVCRAVERCGISPGSLPEGDSTNPPTTGEGSLRYNSTTNQVEVWNGTNWLPIVTEDDQPYVTPEMFGAKGDGITNDRLSILNASSTGIPVLLSKVYLVGSNLTLPANTKMFGKGTITLGNNIFLRPGNDNDISDITISSVGKIGIGISVSGSTNVRLQNLRVNTLSSNGIALINSTNCLITGCIINDVGNGVNATSQGFGIYVSGCTYINISNNIISNTRGFGGVGVVGSSKVGVYENNIFSTFYRGIHIAGVSNKINIVANILTKIGEINDTGSGVGCNGIFSSSTGDPTTLTITSNTIEEVAENGIEAAGFISGNTIKTTGYRNLTTPSKEGIVFGTRSQVTNNIVIGSVGNGISRFGSPLESIEVSNNKVINAVGYGIRLQPDGASIIAKNIVVKNNTVINDSDDSIAGYFILGTTGASFESVTTIIQNNILLGRTLNNFESGLSNVIFQGLGETSGTAYRGDRGKTAYDHSQITSGTNPHNTTFANISSKPTSISGYGITDALTQGGNIFGVSPSIGSNDNFPVSIRVNNAVVATINSSGQYSGAGVVNSSTSNNARVSTSITGVVIDRNINDANTLAKFNYINASGTGSIAEFQKAGVTLASVNNTGTMTATKFAVPALNTAPASATDTGTTGEIRLTAGFIYVCIATNTWVRSVLTTF